MNQVLSMLNLTLQMAAPLSLCALGGLFANRAGVLNIAMDGMINMGAFGSILFIVLTGNVFLGCVLGVVCTLLMGLLFSLFGIRMGGNQIIVGLAVNLFSLGLVPFLLQAIAGNRTSMMALDYVDPLSTHLDIPILRSIPILGPIFNDQTILTYAWFVLIFVAWVVLYKTRFGIYVRVVGENKEAARAVGIKSGSIKLIALLISAAMAGIAGINLSVESLGMYTFGMVAGRGYIALAAIRCGRGDPVQVCGYTLLFGAAKALQVKVTSFVDSATASLIEMLPYIFIIVVMVLSSVMKSRNNHLRGYAND